MTMAVYNRTVTDGSGVPVAGAHVEIRSEVPGQPLAALYSDRAGTSGKTNPFDTDSNGDLSFFVAGGAYRVRIYTGSSGAPTTEKILRYEAIGLSAETDGVGVKSQRVITAAGTDTMTADDADLVLFNKTVGAASRIILPASSTRTRDVGVADRKFDAASNNIKIVPKRPNTFTMTIASPSVFTKAAHGLALDQPVSLETTGALPTNFAADTQYYVKTVPTADTFTLAATVGGSAINGTGSQSGVHTFGTDTIRGGASLTISTNGGSVNLTPLSDSSGYI